MMPWVNTCTRRAPVKVSASIELLSAMSLFQYRTVSLLLIVTFVIVIAAERLSALLRARLG